jgi:hypothetical protein
LYCSSSPASVTVSAAFVAYNEEEKSSFSFSLRKSSQEKSFAFLPFQYTASSFTGKTDFYFVLFFLRKTLFFN